MNFTSIVLDSPVTAQFLLAMLTIGIITYIVVRASAGRANNLSKRWPIYVLRTLFLLVLLLVLLNPVSVAERDGRIEPAQVFFLLDASESMAIGNDKSTRWDQAIDLIRGATDAAHQTATADVGLFRFGRQLKAVKSLEEIGLKDKPAKNGRGITFAQTNTGDSAQDQSTTKSVEPLDGGANEPDTQLLVALRQISSRFGRKPPSAIVVFSDGRTRDAARTEEVGTYFSDLGIPIHTVPLGSTESLGDVSIVSLIAPDSARKQSEVQTHAFLRSYGYDGQRVEVSLNSIDEDGKFIRRLTSAQVTLKSGFQSIPLTFRTDAETRHLEAVVSQCLNEVSTDNNRFETSILVSREKIRVLYVEGSSTRSLPTATVGGTLVMRGPASALQQALQADVDVECVTVPISVGRLNSSGIQYGSFPQSVAELSAFDAIFLSDVPWRTFTEKQLQWIESWVRRRGGGLCMMGGKNSFASGNWKGTPLEKILPVQLVNDFDWNDSVNIAIQTDTNSKLHPLLRIVSDATLNRQIISSFPGFHGGNVNLLPKPNLTNVIAVARPNGPAPKTAATKTPGTSSFFSVQGVLKMLASETPSGDTQANESTEPNPEFSAITVGRYGKGRTMAMAMPITGSVAEDFLQWGNEENENQYYAQFWRNATYWLTEQSYVGRRRLVVNADRRYYEPGQTIILTGSAFDEIADETSSYRLEGVIEPQSFDNIESDYSIVRWPNNVPREADEDSPFIIWGESFEIPVKKIGGRNQYQVELPVAETLPSGTSNQSLRLELTAYENFTQVDSTSVPIQILHDPFEQQNPFPDHELLASLAAKSGGSVLKDEHALAQMLTDLPITHGPSEFSKTPLWSSVWVMTLLLGLISSEWCYRRWIGLA